MTSTLKILPCLLLAATAAPVMAANTGAGPAYPSFGFTQEMSGVTDNGDIAVDLSTAGLGEIRIGAFKGEIMIDPNSTGAATDTGMGYKYPINRNVAVYGKLYLNTGGATSVTNITFGGTYTGNSGDLTYSANAEAFSNAGGTSFNLKGAGFYKLKTNKLGGKMSVGAEIDMTLSPSPTTTDLYFGLRWQPKAKLIVDAGLATSSAGTTTFATPAFVRLNLGL